MKCSVWAVLIAAFGLGLSALSGCGKAVSTPSVGGETHWLQHCGGEGESGFDCGPGLECECGVCTTACTDDANCSGAGDGAVCAERGATTYADGCESAAPQRLCVASSDVVLVTAISPPAVSVDPEPADGSCGNGLFSTEVGCISGSEVRRALQSRAPEIQAKYSACKSDEDCQLVVASNNCDQTCGVAVNREYVTAYSLEMADLGNAYCRAAAEWPVRCGIHEPNCRATFVACEPFSGRCYATALPDLCTGRPLDRCEDDGCTVETGRLYDVANQCFSARSDAIRCVQRSYVCPNEPTPAVDAAGNCYFLDDECIPESFQEAPPDNPCSTVLGKICGT